MVVPVLLLAVMVVCWAVTRRPRPVPPPGPVPLIPRAESTEGLLVAQLFGGDLTPAQYRRAMACLAQRDDSRHPLPLPE
ncbi:hypothetical protein [Actinoplanes flavus]|uniref:SHOCT domain-containing protein n=1 Tax=Actinoplanes flavus TaxID=2820290 RepID=A0ABS3UJK2_9ACTN|nr:hypothetical protein [Actinoplanes flavus]MBO3738920.1 hypothetical protein [Actinoplanes flavus]